jgi:dolichol-phosphate mannosyltransferase
MMSSPRPRPRGQVTAFPGLQPGTENALRSKTPRVTIVVPTFREAENLPHLIDRVAKIRESLGLDVDLHFMDDDSRDGSAEVVAARSEKWVHLLVRTRDRGLSQSVLEGFNRAEGDVLVCMDADLSHPPEAIPDMLAKLEEGADFVAGSRYISGGTTSDDWGVFRWLNSRVATLLARPLTPMGDPMSGFFALRRSTFHQGSEFNPVGYKIGLELIVRCRCERVVEIPIHFEDRRYGQSKLSLRQQLQYLQHLRRLYIFKYGVWSQATQFLLVGGMGTLVNLVALTLLVKLRLPLTVSVATAIFGSMCFNFVFNRRFAFSAARNRAWPRQFVNFIAASSVGALINYATTVSVLARVPGLRPQVAALIGIMIGTAFNFAASRYLVFRASHIKPQR